MEQITLDIIPSGVRENAYASQYDIGRTIRFNLKSGGATYTLTGAETVTMRVRKPDNTERTESITNTSSTYVDWTIVNGTCDLDGLYDCELVVMNGSVKIGSANFTLNTEIDPFSGKAVVLMATGNPVHFNTDLGGILVDCECELPYKADGYTSARVINSATSPVLDQTPYLTRPLPLNAGNRLLDMIVGGTVVFNQLVNGITDYKNTLTDTRGYLQLRIMVNSEYIFNKSISTDENIVTIINSNFTSTSGFIIKHDGSQQDFVIYTSPSTDNIITGHKYLFKANVISTDTTTVNGVEIKDIQLIDLTQMLGLTIADYVYSLESGTAGAGVNWLKAHGFISKDYYAYNSGTLVSVKPTKHIEVGKNLLDINNCLDDYFISSGNMKITSIEGASVFYCKVPFNTDVTLTPDKSNRCVILGYYSEPVTVANSVGDVLIYDSASGIVSKTFNTGNCSFICFYLNRTAEYKPTQIQLEIGTISTAYEPYTKHEYTLNGGDLYGLFKLDANNKLYADGNTYKASGEVGLRYGIVDLSTLSWSQTALTPDIPDAYVTGGLQGLAKYPANNSTPLVAICSDYMIMSVNSIYTNNKSIAMNNGGNLYVRNDGAGVSPTGYLVYELATPTTSTADPFTNPQVCENGGSEEYTDTRAYAVPVGHDSVYGTDMTVNEAEFGVTVYGGSIDFTTGELISDKNPDGTDKSPADEYSLTPIFVPVREGDNYIITDADGTNTVKYFKKG